MEKKSYEQRARIIVNKMICIPSVAELLHDLKNHDENSFVHSVNVAFIATQMGLMQSFDKQQISILSTGALLHDIGKLNISGKLLNKNTKLTVDEFVEIKKHPMYGYDLIKKGDFAPEIKDIILSHHERMDGKGYPNGIVGELIPLHVRLVSVADAYDAMTSKRAYKREFSGEYAIMEIKDSLYTAYDKNALRLLINCLDR